MKKQIIAVDLDDVLSQTSETILQHVNTHYGTNHTSDDYSIEAPYFMYWEKVWGVSEDEAVKRYQSYKRIRNSHHMKPIEGAAEAIKKLVKDFDLVIVTARSDSDAQATKDWLDKHYPSIFGDIKFVPAAWDPGTELTKANVCQEIGASYLIDDSFEHCEIVAKTGVTSLLFGKYGWNKNKKLVENIVRVEDWAAVLEYFSEQG